MVDDLALCERCREPIAKHVIRAGEVIHCPRDVAEIEPGNYVQSMIHRIRVELPDIEPDLAELYALLALTRGGECTLQDVHDAWAIWRNRSNPDHHSLIPFQYLSTEVQLLDGEYRDGIVRATLRATIEDAPWTR